MTESAVAVEGVTKRFPLPFRRTGVVGLSNLDFEVAPGEVYGLLGPNGSGKSTTLKIILGLVTPSVGRSTLFGRDSREVSSREGVGFLPENPYFYKYLTGAETLAFYGKLCRLGGRSLRARIDEVLALVGLEQARDRRLRDYSKGMLQRIGLAQALIEEPRLVVLDEPTAGVDPEGSCQIRDLILEFKRRGITVLLSSHLLSQAEEICDRVGILVGGRLVREGSVADLLAIENRTELILENATPEVLARMRSLVEQSGIRLLAQRRARTNLEDYFLDLTRSKPPA